MSPLRSRIAAALTAALAVSFVAAAPAEARRGGSFGSRGSRTYTAPRSTYTAPGYVPPIRRSMTPQSPGGFQPGRTTYAPSPSGYPAQGRSFRPGFGGGFVSGLLTGGLIGGLMGHHWGGGGWGGYGGGYGGYGGGAGMLGGLFQLLLIGFAIWFVVRLVRRRQGAQPAGFTSPFADAGAYDPGPAPGPGFGGSGGYAASAVPADIQLTPADQQAFEQLLREVQDAFGREDYGALRERTTPEVMSYLAEELSDNATHGRRNEVSNLRLLQADIAEAWREGDADYATAALKYESIDVMRDRQTGAVLQGDPNTPTPTTELWTFVRRSGAPWKLSAIQET